MCRRIIIKLYNLLIIIKTTKSVLKNVLIINIFLIHKFVQRNEIILVYLLICDQSSTFYISLLLLNSDFNNNVLIKDIFTALACYFRDHGLFLDSKTQPKI